MPTSKVSLRINLAGLEGTLQALGRSMRASMDAYSIMARQAGKSTALRRFAVLHAEMGVRSARTIPDGRRRHGIVKARRDALRAARKAEMEASR